MALVRVSDIHSGALFMSLPGYQRKFQTPFNNVRYQGLSGSSMLVIRYNAYTYIYKSVKLYTNRNYLAAQEQRHTREETL